MNSHDHQNFCLQENLVTYELPINEKARNFLKMEYFYSQIDACVVGEKLDSGATVSLLIELSDFINRSDLRKDLITELERVANAFRGFSGNPQVDPNNLEKVIATIKDSLTTLKSRDYKPGNCLKADELIHQVRQKNSSQKGVAKFDLPRFYFWSNLSQEEKILQIEKWMSDILLLKNANTLMLEIIRGSSVTSFETALEGFFQRSLDKEKVSYLLRFSLPMSLPVFPEASGGKHRFTVRFFHHYDTSSKPKQTSDAIHLQVQICGI